MIETGFIVFLSLAVLIFELPNRWILWLCGHPKTFAMPFSILAYVLHFGTFSGMMAAAVAAVMCFLFTRVVRHGWGYIDGGKLHRGIWKLDLAK